MSIYGNSAIIGGGGSGQIGSYLTVYVPSWVTTVSCTMNSKAAKRVYSETGMVVFMIVDTGTYTIRGEGSGVSAEKQLPLTNLFSGYVTALCNLEESSWDVISNVSKGGIASNTWNVNDRKNITINGDRYEFAIMGFDNYDVVDPTTYGRTKNGITFGMVNCMNTKQKMNSIATSEGGWGSSLMKQTCNGFILDSELSNILVYCEIPYCASNIAVALSYDTSSKLFLPSYAEVYGNQSYQYEPKAKEGSQFAYYANGGPKAKTALGSVSGWWLRSVNTYGNNYFCGAGGNGYINNLGVNATVDNGCAPRFCV